MKVKLSPICRMLRSIRKDFGYSQRDIATKLGKNLSWWTMRELGTARTTLADLQLIAKVLRVEFVVSPNVGTIFQFVGGR